MSRPVAAIILAAGRATRFGSVAGDSKVVAMVEGVPMVRRVAEAALASRARPVFVVTGNAADAVGTVLGDLPVRLLHNADFAAGMAGSLRLGISALPEAAEGALILLADMPLVAPGTLDRLIETYDGDVDAVVPSHEGRRGNPVLVARRLFPPLMAERGDHGARAILNGPGRSIVHCPVDDPGVLIDFDTRDALRAMPNGANDSGADAGGPCPS